MLSRVILRMVSCSLMVLSWCFMVEVMVSMVWLVQSMGGRSCMGRVFMVWKVVVIFFFRVIFMYPLGSGASVNESRSGEPA